MRKKISISFSAIILAIILTVGCTNQDSNKNADDADGIQIGDIAITSSAFQNGENIPI